jgi:hypothetical protein
MSDKKSNNLLQQGFVLIGRHPEKNGYVFVINFSLVTFSITIKVFANRLQ